MLREANMLDEELAFFSANKNQWLQEHKGKFALVKGSQLIGVYDSPENAYVEAVKRFGNSPVLIKQISEDEQEIQIPALTLGLLSAHP